jgi:hypothetical protein
MSDYFSGMASLVVLFSEMTAWCNNDVEWLQFISSGECLPCSLLQWNGCIAHTFNGMAALLMSSVEWLHCS